MTIDEVDDQQPFARTCGCVCVKAQGNSFRVIKTNQGCRNECSLGLVIDALDDESFSQDPFLRALEDTFGLEVKPTNSRPETDTGSGYGSRIASKESQS